MKFEGSNEGKNSSNDSVNELPAAPGGIKKNAFVHKLYYMLSDPNLSHLIWWNEDNEQKNTFSLLPGKEFSQILTNYFKHGNVASFVRQLHMYGFHKVNDNNSDNAIWEFKHSSGKFKKDDEDSLILIKRRSSSNSSKNSGNYRQNHPHHPHQLPQSLSQGPLQSPLHGHGPPPAAQHYMHPAHQVPHHHPGQPLGSPVDPNMVYSYPYYYNEYMMPVYYPYNVNYPPQYPPVQVPVPQMYQPSMPGVAQLPPGSLGPASVPLPPHLHPQMHPAAHPAHHAPSSQHPTHPAHLAHPAQGVQPGTVQNSGPPGPYSPQVTKPGQPQPPQPQQQSQPTTEQTQPPKSPVSAAADAKQEPKQEPVAEKADMKPPPGLRKDLKEPVPQRHIPSPAHHAYHRPSNTSPHTIPKASGLVSPRMASARSPPLRAKSPGMNPAKSPNPQVQQYHPLQFRKIWDTSGSSKPRNPSLLFDPLAPNPHHPPPHPHSHASAHPHAATHAQATSQHSPAIGVGASTASVASAASVASVGSAPGPGHGFGAAYSTHSSTSGPTSAPGSLSGASMLHSNRSSRDYTKGGADNKFRPSLIDMYKFHDSISTNNSIFSNKSSLSSISSQRDSSVTSITERNNSFGAGPVPSTVRSFTPPPLKQTHSPILRSASSNNSPANKVSINSLLEEKDVTKRRKLSDY